MTVAPNRAELFQTVTQHKGQRSWSWKLDTQSSPQIVNGYVGFFSKTGELLPLQIDPVQILDGQGKPVTPHGLEWGLDRRGGAWWLTLRLDDAKLPLPYTIDPASTYMTSAAGTWTGTGTSTVTIPATVQAGDLLIVQQSGVVGSTAYPTGPTDNNGGTWTSLTAVQHLTVSQLDAYRFASGTDAGKTVTVTPSSAATGTTVNLVALHVFRGPDLAQAIATGQTAATNGTGRNIACAAVTPAAGTSAATPEHLMCLMSATSDANANPYSAATGMAPWTYRFDTASGTAASSALFSTEATSTTPIAAVLSSNNPFSSGIKDVSVDMGFNTDATPPTVTNVSSTKANGSYPSGTLIPITVTFSEAVNVTGTPTLALNSGGTASYSSGSGTSTLTFNYTTGAGDNTADLDYSATNSLALAGGTIQDGAGNNATLTLPTVGGASSIGGQKNIVVDTNNPTASVTTPAVDGNSYNAAGLPANIAGSSADTGGSSTVSSVQVAIQDGAGNYWGGATFNQGSIFYNATGGTVGAWTYSTATLAGQLTTGHTYTITAKSTDPAGNTGTATRTFIYDTTAPTVSSVSSTKADGAYPSGTSIPITVTFSENVTVTGSPTLALNSGGTATYSSGSGGATLTFAYTTAGGENTADLDYSATSSLALSGGTIKDAATNNATLTLPAVGGANSIGGQKNIVVDTSNPTASVTTPAANGTVYNAAGLPANLAGSSADTGGSSTVSSVQVAIQDGAGNYWGGATFNQGSIFYNATGGTVGAWTYSTATLAGQLTDGHTYTITAKSTDAAGNTGTTTRTFVYDTTAPTVTNVSSTKANGTYPSGTSIPITITFSENVTVTGSPTLALNSGGTATYSSGSGTSTLTFAYTTAGGENSADLDYTATNSLALAGGTIKDAATNNATLTLPAVGGASSIGGQKNIVVDTSNPTASVTTPASDGLSYNATALPANIAGSSADTGGSSTVSSGAGRDPGRRRQLLGRRHLQPGLDLLQRNRRHRGRVDIQHGHTRGPAHERPHLHDHRQVDRPGRQHRHHDADLRLRHHRPDRDERLLDEGRRQLPIRHIDPDHGHVQRERRRHRQPDARAQLRRHRDLQLRLRHLHPHVRLHDRGRRKHRRPRLHGHELARARRRHDQGCGDEQRDADSADCGRRQLDRRPEEHRGRHHRTDGDQCLVDEG